MQSNIASGGGDAGSADLGRHQRSVGHCANCVALIVGEVHGTRATRQGGDLVAGASQHIVCARA